jgi:hypothetical protein
MYKNFNLTEEERQQIMESHKSHGYKKPLNEHMASFVHGSRLEHEPKYQVGDLVRVLVNTGGWDRRPEPHKGTVMAIEKKVGINNNESYIYEVHIEGGDSDVDQMMFNTKSFSHKEGDLIKVPEHLIDKKY